VAQGLEVFETATALELEQQDRDTRVVRVRVAQTLLVAVVVVEQVLLEEMVVTLSEALEELESLLQSQEVRSLVLAVEVVV
jgi:hypothetical protein